MKKKYLVKDFNGVFYKGKFYSEGSIIELDDVMFKSMKDSGVKLEEATPEQVRAYEEALQEKPVHEQNLNADNVSD